MNNVAVIKICPEGETQAEIETNGVSHLDILDGLDALMRGLAREVVEEAKKYVGSDPKRIERWIDYMRQHPEQN